MHVRHHLRLAGFSDNTSIKHRGCLGRILDRAVTGALALFQSRRNKHYTSEDIFIDCQLILTDSPFCLVYGAAIRANRHILDYIPEPIPEAVTHIHPNTANLTSTSATQSVHPDAGIGK
jgi:hypothetical protein